MLLSGAQPYSDELFELSAFEGQTNLPNEGNLSETVQDQIVAFTDCTVSEKYPPNILQWCELISHYAKQRDLPPDLVAALIWQESGGSPSAYSGSGAVGLMQVMPSDGIAASFMCQNGPCFSSRPPTQKLKDPEFNISYGTKMLARLMEEHGDTREALKAYGPMDVGYYYSDKVIGIFKQYKD
jgi:soluble lytic murein transglycosylase-like protein